jgi:hypothetical protein
VRGNIRRRRGRGGERGREEGRGEAGMGKRGRGGGGKEEERKEGKGERGKGRKRKEEGDGGRECAGENHFSTSPSPPRPREIIYAAYIAASLYVSAPQKGWSVNPPGGECGRFAVVANEPALRDRVLRGTARRGTNLGARLLFARKRCPELTALRVRLAPRGAIGGGGPAVACADPKYQSDNMAFMSASLSRIG